jgi:mRNA-degrading endonuclease RelE of RelBE toxin-antitoxin system
MVFSVDVTSNFKKEAKRLIHKYPSLKKEIDSLINSLATTPEQGTSIGKGCYKIRLAIASKGKGKSGGARIITHIQILKTKVYLIAIYDKSELGSLTSKELTSLLKMIPE